MPTTSEEKPLASEPDALVSEIKTSASEEKALALDTSISNNEDALSPDLPKGSHEYLSVETLCLVLETIY